MNKYALLMAMVFFLILITQLTLSLDLSVTEDLTHGISSSDKVSVKGVMNMIKMFFRIITFQVPDIPVIINLLVFLPLTFGIIYIIVDIIKDLIPFT